MKIILLALIFFVVAALLHRPVWRCFDILRKDPHLKNITQSYILIALWTLLIAMGISILTGVIIIK